MFEALMYPDNENRTKRVTDLGSDCVHSSNALLNQKVLLESAMAKVNESFKNAFGSVGKPVQFERLDLTKAWYVSAAPGIASIIGSALVDRVFMQTFARAQLEAGKITAEELGSVFKAPKWFNIRRFGSSMGAALVISLVFEAAIDAVNGALVRDKMQQAIKDMSTPRFQLKRAEMVNDVLIAVLTGMAAAYDTQVRFLKKMALSDDVKNSMLETFTEEFIIEAQNKIAEINDEAVIAALAQIDSTRGSWLNEDGKPDTSLVLHKTDSPDVVKI
ncbi:hypothetical protein [Pseudomonas sp. NPDC089406]|uniref:hypothetical protein n=1 Tax=Pseudomonas sp. NPDC089406 TaxID=3364463 RepID=UPI00384AE20E